VDELLNFVGRAGAAMAGVSPLVYLLYRVLRSEWREHSTVVRAEMEQWAEATFVRADVARERFENLGSRVCRLEKLKP